MITLVLHGGIVPKARPRVTANGTFMPRAYSQWKRSAITDFLLQTNERNLSGVSINVKLTGKHSRRGDADNVIGSILDALKQAQIIQDDNLTHIPSIACALDHSKDEPKAIIEIF